MLTWLCVTSTVVDSACFYRLTHGRHLHGEIDSDRCANEELTITFLCRSEALGYGLHTL